VKTPEKFCAGDKLTKEMYNAIKASGVFHSGEIVTAEKVNANFSKIFGDEMTPLYDLLDEAKA